MYDAPNMQWFHIDDFDEDECVDAAGKRFDEYITGLENDQQGRMTDLMKFGSMYQNVDMMYSTNTSITAQMPAQITNVTQAIVDALVAKQVVNESKATFDVDDGDWEAHVKAEQLDKFVFGEFYRCKVYELHEQGFRDAAWSGDGWLKYTARNRKVYCEKPFPGEIRIDPAACVSGPPREMYEIRYIARSLAQSMYPKYAAQIALLPNCEPPYQYPNSNNGDGQLVRLQEGWHLPDEETQSYEEEEIDEMTGKPICTGKRGAYMFACNGVVLDCKEWKRTRFPFVRIPYSR